MTANKTLDLDKLFVRDIFFKDYSNRPIPANKILTTRGDGGIYFGTQAVGEVYPAFNEFQAGSNVTTPASNVYNKLWLEEGAGIQFYNVIDGLQPKTYIASTAPEQITVLGDGGTVNFSSLKENLVGGRTLYFDYKGDAIINVSDTTVTFGTAFNSSYSSLTLLTSTTMGIQGQTSTIQGNIQNTINKVDTLLVSTTLSTFFSTLEYTKYIVEQTSSFVFSTFNLLKGSTKLEVGELQATSISTNILNAPCINTSSIKIGSNVLTEFNVTGSNADLCTAYLSTGIASTYTNYFNIQDNYTDVKFSIEKNRIVSLSTYGTSSLQVIGNQVHIGWFPQLSTQSGALPPTMRGNYIPILQQTEIIEQSVERNRSTVTKYMLKNVGKFDEICADKNLTITAPNVTISRLTVDTINSINPFKVEFLSTFSTLFVSSALGTNLIISTVRYSTLRGFNIRSEFISTGQLSTNNGFIEMFGYSTSQGILSYAETISSINTHFDIATGDGLSTNYLSTGNMYYDRAIGSTLHGSNIEFGLASGTNVSTQHLSTGLLEFGQAAGRRLSTNILMFGTATGESMNTSSLRVSTIMGTDLPIFTFDMGRRRVGLNLGDTQQPRATLDISGIVYANNFVTTSDRRLKSQIEPLCISNIPRSYRYVNHETEEVDIGVMADEIEHIAPECVYTRSDGYKAVSYIKLVPVCLSLIQSLSARLAALEGQI